MADDELSDAETASLKNIRDGMDSGRMIVLPVLHSIDQVLIQYV
jgi:hypothetical protein